VSCYVTVLVKQAQVGFAEEEVDGSLAILLEIVCLVHTCRLEWSENDILVPVFACSL
jgi:hypothetical protein